MGHCFTNGKRLFRKRDFFHPDSVATRFLCRSKSGRRGHRNQGFAGSIIINLRLETLAVTVIGSRSLLIDPRYCILKYTVKTVAASEDRLSCVDRGANSPSIDHREFRVEIHHVS